MATITVQQMEREVRYVLGAQNLSLGTLDPDVILAAVGRAVKIVQAETDSTPIINSSWLSLTANTYSYAVGGSIVDLSSINQLRLTYDGRILTRVDVPTLMQFRQGTTVLVSTPLIIAFEEAQAGTYTALVWPTPDQSYTVEASTVSIPGLPDDFFTSGGGAYASNFTLPGYTYGAVVYTAAAELAANPAVNLSAASQAVIQQQSRRMISAESRRVSSLIRQPGVKLVSNV